MSTEQQLEPHGGNVYRRHVLTIDHQGTLWRCGHGSTGLDNDSTFIGCAECAADIAAEVKVITLGPEMMDDWENAPLIREAMNGGEVQTNCPPSIQIHAIATSVPSPLLVKIQHESSVATFDAGFIIASHADGEFVAVEAFRELEAQNQRNLELISDLRKKVDALRLEKMGLSQELATERDAIAAWKAEHERILAVSNEHFREALAKVATHLDDPETGIDGLCRNLLRIADERDAANEHIAEMEAENAKLATVFVALDEHLKVTADRDSLARQLAEAKAHTEECLTGWQLRWEENNNWWKKQLHEETERLRAKVTLLEWEIEQRQKTNMTLAVMGDALRFAGAKVAASLRKYQARYHGAPHTQAHWDEADLALKLWTELPPQETFQRRVHPWLLACFGLEITMDAQERCHRFLEEALELVQACGCTRGEAVQLVGYVFDRPVGEKSQEVGGVMVTLAALCIAQSLDMHGAGETELSRIWGKIDVIRAKQAAKPKHSPLPGPNPDSTFGTDERAPKSGGKLVTVCDKCLQASCWQGIFMCDESPGAGTVEKTIEELESLGRENPSYWQ